MVRGLHDLAALKAFCSVWTGERQTMKLRFSAVFASLVLVGLLSASPALAAPIVIADVTDLGGGMFRYGYDLSNLFDSTENVFDFGLYFAGDPLNVSAPANWDFISGTGFIDWFSIDPQYDLAAGSHLGFSFDSAFAPGAITFSTLGASAVTGDVGVTEYGDTTGPTSARVPEPSTLWLFGAAGLVAWVAQRRRSPLAS